MNPKIILGKENKTLMDTMFNVQMDLRSDYHSSKNIYYELNKKNDESKNVISDLLEFANPERIGFKLVDRESTSEYEFFKTLSSIIQEEDGNSYSFRQ